MHLSFLPPAPAPAAEIGKPLVETPPVGAAAAEAEDGAEEAFAAAAPPPPPPAAALLLALDFFPIEDQCQASA